MTFPWTRTRILLVALLAMVVVLARSSFDIGFDAVSEARLPNPDSFYKLVLLEDHDPQVGFHFVARDNAPDGNWVHWSLPHSWTVWQLHRPLAFAGLSQRQALLWAGVSVTLASVMLLAMLVALAVAQHGSKRAALVSILTVATSLPLMAYGRIDQITHHIFMLVPVAGAAACFFTPATCRGHWPDLLGGLLLGLALWISPETMPLVAGLAALRAVLRLEHGDSPSLIPVAVGLLATMLLGWAIDPPPPTYAAWALDHISLAWLAFAALLAMLLGVGEGLARYQVTLRRALLVMAGTSVAAGLGWLLLVPHALHGPIGLIPDELRSLWWDQISELKSADTPAQFVAYFGMPLAAALVAAFAAWRIRSVTLTLLALMTLTYAVLGVWHVRMGAAAALVAALAVGLGVARLRIFTDDVDDTTLTAGEQAIGLFLTLLPVLLLCTVLGLTLLADKEARRIECPLASVSEALNQLPPATVLAPVFRGPELLYHSHHRTIAGPYHHNVDGILDVYRAWLDTGDTKALTIIERREVEYVLGCTDIQAQLRGNEAEPTLARRAAEGNVPDWLEPVQWAEGTETRWRLYRVVDTE